MPRCSIGVLILVALFKTSSNLASAYGIAVTGTFMCDTTLAMVVFRRQFNWSRTAAVAIFGGLFLIDATFFSANSLKFLEGGWVPLVFGLALVALMTSWKRGRESAAGALAAGQHAARAVPRPPAAIAQHPARAGPGGVSDRQPGLRADLAAAQPQA